MGGGLMQLVAYGAQDVYLTGKPQITFFKIVYRRHTNFSVEPIQQTFQGAAEFGRTVTCNVNRNGDLITNMHLVCQIEGVERKNWGYVSRLGHALISSYKIEVGGSKIDEQYGDWLNISYELSRNTGHDRGYAEMIGDIPELTNLKADAGDSRTLYVPLRFWFNRHNGLALPLIALQYHDVRVTLNLREAKDLVNWTGSSSSPPKEVNNDLMKDAYLLIDYVYLDSVERKRFAQAAHEYLIEQVQFTGDEVINSDKGKYRLNFNHPSKYLVWNTHFDRYTESNAWLAWAVDGDWEKAKEQFAKRLWLATRSDLIHDGDGTYQITLDDSTIEQGDVPAAVQSLGKPVGNLLSKIEAQLLFQGSGVNATADESNVVVLKNELTMEDLNNTVSELSAADNMTTAGKALLAANQVWARDYHNHSVAPNNTGNPIKDAKLQLNGHDRFTTRDGKYFNCVQPYQHFNNTPSDGINLYSFAIKPEDHQPSGTCNFSRIDNTTLNLSINNSSGNGVCRIYAVNYNVFRVMSGMGGLTYSN